MKNLNMLVWLTQLGLSVAGPLAGFILAAVWLRQRFGLGVWVLIIGIALGISGAIDGFRVSMKAMEQMSKDKPGEQEPPPVSFNDHN
ncbi:MAG: AtpZ/AtpI family protein [Oscillospiraceae bacterium]|nr:AtpZ/AtpI family protein [Oscillospiraceae bacterium]